MSEKSGGMVERVVGGWKGWWEGGKGGGRVGRVVGGWKGWWEGGKGGGRVERVVGGWKGWWEGGKGDKNDMKYTTVNGYRVEVGGEKDSKTKLK